MTIEIGPRAQLVALLVLLGVAGAAIYVQWPEVERYLKAKEM